MPPMLVIPNHLLSVALKNDERWHTFEEIIERLHKGGIYIHPEQLAEFLLAHGLPVHPRYVPAHLRLRAIEINEHYQGDMVRLIEELEPPCWDFSWMSNVQISSAPNDPSDCVCPIEEQEQPSWDYS